MPFGQGVAPGFESLPIEGEESEPIGPDGWYDVDRSGERSSGTGAPISSTGQTGSTAGLATLERWDSTQNRLILGSSLMAIIGSVLAFLMWRRRRSERAVQSVPNSKLTAGVRSSIDNQMPTLLQDAPPAAKPKAKKPAPPIETANAELDAHEADEALELKTDFPPAPEEAAPEADTPVESTHELQPKPEPQPEPVVDAAPPAPVATPSEAPISGDLSLDLSLEVVSASRSMMMFTIDFRLDIANRDDRAVRDLNVAAKLACAQRGGASGSAGDAQLSEVIARIGPNQSGRIAGQLQLPLSEVQPMRQGSKPLFIPLLHVNCSSEGSNRINRSFVLGTPSATSAGRVHPLPLDGPPGSLPPLRAQLIKQPADAPA